jgi:uncharacterized protein YndB with AHSA1/START domain
MSAFRRQAQIDVPVERLWDLVGNPERHPEWWPRVIEVSGERFEQGDEYVQVTRTPLGEGTSHFAIERMDEELHEIHMRCQTSGTFARWLLTPAQEGTFVELDIGMDPKGPGYAIYDRTLGRLYFRRWADQSLDGLREAAAPAESAPGARA